MWFTGLKGRYNVVSKKKYFKIVWTTYFFLHSAVPKETLNVDFLTKKSKIVIKIKNLKTLVQVNVFFSIKCFF